MEKHLIHVQPMMLSQPTLHMQPVHSTFLHQQGGIAAQTEIYAQQTPVIINNITGINSISNSGNGEQADEWKPVESRRANRNGSKRYGFDKRGAYKGNSGRGGYRARQGGQHQSKNFMLNDGRSYVPNQRSDNQMFDHNKTTSVANSAIIGKKSEKKNDTIGSLENGGQMKHRYYRGNSRGNNGIKQNYNGYSRSGGNVPRRSRGYNYASDLQQCGFRFATDIVQ